MGSVGVKESASTQFRTNYDCQVNCLRLRERCKEEGKNADAPTHNTAVISVIETLAMQAADFTVDLSRVAITSNRSAVLRTHKHDGLEWCQSVRFVNVQLSVTPTACVNTNL